EVTVISLVSGSGSKMARSVTSLVGPLVASPMRARWSPPSPWPNEVTKSSFSTKLRGAWRMMMKISPQALEISGAPPPPGSRGFGLVVGTNHRGVEVGEAIDLRATEEADGEAPALQPVAEHFRHRHGGERGVAQFAVADRERQHVGFGGDRAGFVDQRDVGRM